VTDPRVVVLTGGGTGIPAGRPGRPEEIAAVVYLASPEAAYDNGGVHHVNGGWLFGR
jgi:NAD(P)-dependent dehydrogenase (short-subunit alcohol dehydrogenase family)